MRGYKQFHILKNVASHNIHKKTSVRLPEQDLRKFNGDINAWPEFCKQYILVIHANR